MSTFLVGLNKNFYLLYSFLYFILSLLNPYYFYCDKLYIKFTILGFPGGAVVENPPVNAGHTGSSPGLGRSYVPWSSWAHEPQLLSL